MSSQSRVKKNSRSTPKPGSVDNAPLPQYSTAALNACVVDPDDDMYLSDGDGNDTLASSSSQDVEEDQDTVIISQPIRTRSSNGITKKRFLKDASTLSGDDDTLLNISPTKKSRVIGSTKSVRSGDTIHSSASTLTSSEQSGANVDIALSMSPLKLAHPAASASSNVITGPDPFLVESRVLLDAAPIVTGSSSSNKDALSMSTSLSVNASSNDDSDLHPSEKVQLELALFESKREKDKSSTSEASSTLSTTTPKPRRSFKEMYPPSPTTPIVSNGPVLLEDSMKFVVAKLPDNCQVTHKDLQDIALQNDYAALPNLKPGTLYSWSSLSSSAATSMTLVNFSEWANQCPDLDYDTACTAVRFTRHNNFINPCRISPLQVNIYYTSNDRKKSILQCNYKTAICLTPILVRDSHLTAPSTQGLRNKYIAGFFHKQEWQRFEAFSCMVFNRPSMMAQIQHESMYFVTLGSFSTDRDNSSPSKTPRNPNILSSSSAQSKAPRGFTATHFKNVLNVYDEIPVFDSRQHDFNFASDLDNLNSLPLFSGEIPFGSFVVVGYSLGHYDAVKDGVSRANLATNILFAIVLATSD